MRRRAWIVTAALIAMSLSACTQIDRAVKGFEAGPDGWHRAGETSVEPATSSDVTYLGASADGLIIVRTADGNTEVWGPGR